MTTDRTPPLWARLVQWQPATAAALALHIRALPADWPQRVFGVARPDAALLLPPAAHGEQYPDRFPEIAPYDDVAAPESCPACGEAGETCRWHDGFAKGHHDRVQAQLDAVRARPDMPLREFILWEAAVAEALDAGQTPPPLPAATSVPADTIGLCGYCGVPRESHHHGYVSTAAALAAAPLHITATDDPGTLRRAVLREAADIADEEARRLYDGMGQKAAAGARLVGAHLRRLADEAQQAELVISAAELLTLVTVLEIPRPGNGLPLHILRTHPEQDRWAISDRTGRRWFHGNGWMYEAQHLPELERTEARFTLAEALPLAHQLAEEPQP